MDDSSNKGFKIFRRVLFVGVGIFIIVMSILWVTVNLVFISSAKTAKGKVIELPYGGSHPVIAFTTPDGKTIEFPQGGLISGYQVGDEVLVAYDPDDPNICQLDSFGALWGFQVAMVVMGLAFIGVGLFYKN
jgi:hypothetical protein